MKRMLFAAFGLIVWASWLFVEPPPIRAGAIQQLLASYGSASAVSTPFVVGQTIGTIRNNFTGCVGFSFQTNVSITVTDLGRWVVSGNSGTHLVRIIGPDGTTTVASVTVDTSGATANDYAYASITPVVLTGATNYVLYSAEISGGDQWGDNDTTITLSSVWNGVGSAAVSTNAGCASGVAIGFLPNAWVPPSLKYHL